jgi:UDP-N-acetylglucosamine--N-acetylmuramyl-(pentapeptide) pyrophosphoryl-undecaprenol N-acetylglucosamine transferase
MTNKKKIVFTGGGTAGHVTPNIAIMNELKNENYEFVYIGSKKGIEKDLMQKQNITYYGISSGKLRRYLDMENVKDVFRVLKGCFEARKILKQLKPDLLFSKGGFVSVPVIIAANTLKIPIFIHESDITPGLANKISKRFATKIFTSFDETTKYFPQDKVMAIGSPIRKEILTGSAEKGKRFLDFHSGKPILTVMGGSLGAKKINEAVRANIDELTKYYQIVHLCGKNNLDSQLESHPGYRQFEYIHEELADILAATDLVITRGGSNSIFEFLALEIPMLIIPLGLNQSRGDQILNAKSFTEKGFAITLQDEDVTKESLLEHVKLLQTKRDVIKKSMANANQTRTNALTTLVDEIKNVLNNNE